MNESQAADNIAKRTSEFTTCVAEFHTKLAKAASTGSVLDCLETFTSGNACNPLSTLRDLSLLVGSGMQEITAKITTAKKELADSWLNSMSIIGKEFHAFLVSIQTIFSSKDKFVLEAEEDLCTWEKLMKRLRNMQAPFPELKSTDRSELFGNVAGPICNQCCLIVDGFITIFSVVQGSLDILRIAGVSDRIFSENDISKYDIITAVTDPGTSTAANSANSYCELVKSLEDMKTLWLKSHLTFSEEDTALLVDTNSRCKNALQVIVTLQGCNIIISNFPGASKASRRAWKREYTKAVAAMAAQPTSSLLESMAQATSVPIFTL